MNSNINKIISVYKIYLKKTLEIHKLIILAIISIKDLYHPLLVLVNLSKIRKL